jgi:hypothetical protein
VEGRGEMNPQLSRLYFYSLKCLEKLSEKGSEKLSEHGFGRHKESEGAGKSLLGGPQSCTIDAFGAFWTVSRRGLLRSSVPCRGPFERFVYACSGTG